MSAPRRLPPQVVLLGLVSLLNDSASEMIYPLLPVFLTATLGATPVIVGIIEGAADGLSSILKYFAGTWSDRMPRRKPFIVTGYALAAVSRGWIAGAARWPGVLAARLLDRTGKGMRSAPRDAMIADVTDPAARGKAFGFHRALDHAGAIVGPLVALLLLQVFGLGTRAIFLIAVIPGAAGVVLLLFFLHEQPRRAPAGPAMAAGGPLPRRFWHAIAAIALFSLANASDAFLLLKASDAGVTRALLPLLWAAHHVIKSGFSTAAGALSDRIDRRRLLVAGWISYAAIYLVFPMAETLVVFFVLFVLYAIPFTLTEGAERAWIADLVPPESRGRSFGIYYLAAGLCVFGGSAMFGAIYQTLSPAAAFGTAAALAAAAALVASRCR
ncbi:MAG TPA: MFS transporter [Thermoanaerobaculia bacterium]|nr:MFS transporter [Thermoanaerobaculia bacterium]